MHAVRAAIARHLHIDARTTEPGYSLEDDLGMDPLDIALVIMRIESLCDVDVPTERAERVKTVGDIETCVCEQIEAGAAGSGQRRWRGLDASVDLAHRTHGSRGVPFDRVRGKARQAM
jgi:acyl carrier protein